MNVLARLWTRLRRRTPAPNVEAPAPRPQGVVDNYGTVVAPGQPQPTLGPIDLDHPDRGELPG
jgi:hypothetical protein